MKQVRANLLLLLTAMVALACFNIWHKVRRRSRNMY